MRTCSCDTFVALPPATDGVVVFGKNSDRPCDEVQEVVHIPAADHEPGSKVQCTYIEIDQVAHTHSVILSKPSWMWGAEMGANEHGVCIGNEAVWTKLNGPEDDKEKLLGMDLVRLVLERSSTAASAFEVLTTLIETHGQGGPCYEDPDPPANSAYHNSFLLCDSKEAWLIETVGQLWAAEHITSVLGLERSCTAKEALDVVCSLLELHGQGGNCSEDSGSWSYHNSFIICDPTSAWVLETAGNLWAAQHVTSGVRNISNQLTIRTKIDACSSNLKQYAQDKEWWNPDNGPLDFAKVFADGFEETEIQDGDKPCGRQQWGTFLLKKYAENGSFGANDMMKILRHETSGICMTGGFLSTGSQVSVLSSASKSVHWFTATPNPSQSFFKPFIFCPTASIGKSTLSPDYGTNDPRLQKPRFQSKVDRMHPLWKAHEKLTNLLNRGDGKGDMILQQIRELEEHCVKDMEDVVKNYNNEDAKSEAKIAHIFQHMVDIEMNFYK